MIDQEWKELVLIAIFRKMGKATASRRDIINTISFTLRWGNPAFAEKLFLILMKDSEGRCTINNEEIRLRDDLFSKDLPENMKIPTANDLASYKDEDYYEISMKKKENTMDAVAPEDPVGKTVDLIAIRSKLDKQEIISMIDIMMKEKLVYREVAVLYYAIYYGIDHEIIEKMFEYVRNGYFV